MRVLIYSETDNAKKQRESMIEEGHNVSLRNPQYFANEFEQADLVLAESSEIVEAYKAKGIDAEFLIEAKAIETVAEIEEVAQCGFIKTNGEQCKSKALANGFCHIKSHQG